MDNTIRAIDDHEIAQLVSSWPHTVADALPLVMWTDKFHNDFVLSALEPSASEAQREKTGTNSPAPIMRHSDFCSLYVVSQGRGTHIIDGVPYGIARGDVYTMGMGMEHYFVGCNNLQLETIHFSAQLFDPTTREALTGLLEGTSFFLAGALHAASRQQPHGRWLHLAPNDYIQVRRMMAELKTEWLSGTAIGAALTRGLFLRLLVHLARLHAAQPDSVEWKAPCIAARGETIIAAAVHYMDEHFTEPVRIHDIAERVFLSHDRFTAVFSAVMGRTPCDYIHHLRLERAKTLLHSSDLSITAIAQESGFGEVAYFIRAFRKMTGMTPGAYRKQALAA